MGPSSLLSLEAQDAPQRPLSVSQEQQVGEGKKRKRRKDHKKLDRQRKAQKRLEKERQAAAAAAEGKQGEEGSEPEPAEPALKKKRKKTSSGGGVGQEAEEIAAEPAEQQAEWLWGQYKAAGRGGSFLDRGAFAGSSMIPLAKAAEGETFEDRMKQSVPDWRAKFCGGGSKVAKQKAREGAKGAPTVLVITAGAQRAADLIREMPECHGACKIAKLFAKHFKVEQQMEMLRTHVQVAVGTPNRLKKLVDIGALSLTNLQLVVFDLQRDVKQYHLLSLKGVKEDLWDMFSSHLQDLVESGKLKMAIAVGSAPRAGPTRPASKPARPKSKRKADVDEEPLDDDVFGLDYDGY